MTRYIVRHGLQTRITHGIFSISCILLALTGLFVFIPALAAAVPPGVVFAIRMGHRTLGIIFVVIPIISGITAPKGAKHMFGNYFKKWDKDDTIWLKKFIPYMLGPKRVHMPDQRELKSGQVVADGALIVGAVFIAISGIILLVGSNVGTFSAGLMLAMRIVHDVAFIWLIVFGLAHIFLGLGIFQPYRRTYKMMFGNGRVSESDALYHWGYWAREEIETGEHIVEVDDDK